ncbi:MAG: methionyl-tRNA formyltransferase [SAR324 cluster bacterium]|nr:methionyl-tRNA formyltransferase [SAR324 cluster bacterium]
MHPAVFMGSPEFALPSLRALASHSACRITGVFTQPDRPFGRGRKARPSPVRAEAEALDLPVFTPERIGGEEGLALLTEAAPEIVIVCAYGQIFPERVLSLPPGGAYNLHFSLLPRWRGASPVQAAILAGDRETGVSMQRIVRELDAGPVVVESTPLPISAQDTAQSLGERLAEASGRLLASALPLLLEGNPPLLEQEPSLVTHCRTIPKAAGAVDWQVESARMIERKIRAYTPWPGCFTYLGGRRLGLVRLELAGAPDQVAAGGEPPGTLLPGGLVRSQAGYVRLLEVKPEGRGAMPLQAFLNGAPDALGRILSARPEGG